MAKTKATLYTLVQHSGYGYGHDPEFHGGLEERGVTAAQAERIRKQGGVVVDSYMKASDLAQEYSYPEGYHGLRPAATKQGQFLPMRIDGLRVYAPYRAVEVAETQLDTDNSVIG